MSTKTLKISRLALLYKSYEDWQAEKSYIPLKGEVCFCEVATGSSEAQTAPTVLFKVGDGVTDWEHLKWSSALAADVYAWAKDPSLDFAKLDQTFLDNLEQFIGEHSSAIDTKYQIVEDGANKWKLQKSTDEGETWIDAVGTIDLSQTISELESNIAKKTDREVQGTNGKALIFNETDGGGAKFEHNDGTWSYVGVNDGGKNGITGQIYSVDHSNGNLGSRLNLTNDGFFYTSGKSNAQFNADDELVTKKDIKAIEGGMHFIGSTNTQEGETIDEAIARLLQEKGHEPIAGDIIIVNSREVIYDGTSWGEVGDEDNYATKAALAEEKEAREAKEAELNEAITNEVTARVEADAALDERLTAAEEAIEEQEDAREPIYDETLKVLFANGTPITLSDSGSDNIVTYYGAGSTSYSPLTMHIPYNVFVVGGGDGRVKGQYYPSSSIVINGGTYQRVFGGSYGAGTVGSATVIMNGGVVTKGLHGGSMKGSGALVHAGSVGHTKVILNGGTCQSVLSAGGIDMTDTGYSELVINGGSAVWCYGSGANGTFGASDIRINGGEITHLLGTVRGNAQKYFSLYR